MKKSELRDLIKEEIKKNLKEGPFVSSNLATSIEAEYGTVGILEDNLPDTVEEDDVEEIWYDFLYHYIDQRSEEYKQALTQYLNRNYPQD